MKNNPVSRVRAPKGFFFKVEINRRYNEVVVFIYDNKREQPAGHVKLVPSDSRIANRYETHSYLEPEYRGKGLGALMYSKAIQWALDNGRRIQSSGSSSDAAKMVWSGKTIRKFFKLRRRTTSYDEPIWYAYNKG